MAGHLCALLATFALQPQARLSQVSLLSAEERQQVLYDFQGSEQQPQRLSRDVQPQPPAESVQSQADNAQPTAPHAQPPALQGQPRMPPTTVHGLFAAICRSWPAAALPRCRRHALQLRRQ